MSICLHNVPTRRLLANFRVETAPSAWTDLGRVGANVHHRILRAMEEIAAEAFGAEQWRLASDELRGRLEAIVDRHTVVYEIDGQSRTVTLVGVRPESNDQ